MDFPAFCLAKLTSILYYRFRLDFPQCIQVGTIRSLVGAVPPRSIHFAFAYQSPTFMHVVCMITSMQTSTDRSPRCPLLVSALQPCVCVCVCVRVSVFWIIHVAAFFSLHYSHFFPFFLFIWFDHNNCRYRWESCGNGTCVRCYLLAYFISSVERPLNISISPSLFYNDCE